MARDELTAGLAHGQPSPRGRPAAGCVTAITAAACFGLPSVYRQVHFLEQRREPWIVADPAQDRVELDVPEFVVLVERTLEPLERTVPVTPPGVDLCDGFVCVPRDERVQSAL